MTDLPLGVGFGISSPDQAVMLAPHCDGIIVGSVVVETIYKKGLAAAAELVRELRQVI